jgi:hypothetical protein
MERILTSTGSAAMGAPVHLAPAEVVCQTPGAPVVRARRGPRIEGAAIPSSATHRSHARAGICLRAGVRARRSGVLVTGSLPPTLSLAPGRAQCRSPTRRSAKARVGPRHSRTPTPAHGRHGVGSPRPRRRIVAADRFRQRATRIHHDTVVAALLVDAGQAGRAWPCRSKQAAAPDARRPATHRTRRGRQGHRRESPARR